MVGLSEEEQPRIRDCRSIQIAGQSIRPGERSLYKSCLPKDSARQRNLRLAMHTKHQAFGPYKAFFGEDTRFEFFLMVLQQCIQ